MSLAAAKTILITTLTTIFGDTSEGNTASQKAQEVADAIDAYTTAAVATVTLPAGSVIVQVTGGSGAPAVGVPNPADIPLVGDPDSGTGGLT